MKKVVTALCLISLVLLLCFSLVGCGKVEEVKEIDIKITDEEYAFAVNKEDDQLLKDANRILKEIQDDGTLDEILAKYFQGAKVEGVISAAPNPSKDQLVVATNAAFPPFEYKIGEKYAGVDMEVAKILADRLGKELVIKNMEFDSVILSVKTGEANIGMAGLTVNEERKKSVNFSDTYFYASQKIIVRASDTTFDNCKTKEDIENVLKSMNRAKGGYQNGTTGGFYLTGDAGFGFDGFENIKPKGYSNGALAVKKLQTGGLDFVVIDEMPAQSIIASMNNKAKESEWKIFWDSFMLNKGYKEVLQGLLNTLIIAVVGLGIGFVIGVIIAISKVIPQSNWFIKVWSKVSDCYVSVFRGTPIIVQLLILYYVLLPIVGLELNSVVVAFLAFGLNSGAYVSEIIRSGILSVDSGQMEAGRSLGLSYTKTMLGVVLPQAFKNILPTLGNEFIALVKETSVVSFIAATDLTKAFKNIADGTYEYIIPYLMLALCYLIIVLVITYVIKIVERRLRKSDRRS